MEGGTFRTRSMQEAFGRFVMIELHTDTRKPETARLQAVRSREQQKQRFRTIGVPYYVLLDPTGTKVYWKSGGITSEEKFLKALRSIPKSFGG